MIQNLHQIIQLIEGDWHKARILVVGDIMLDRYIWGDVERISPEAPVPIVRAVHRDERPGGAANVAMNVAGLGAKVTLFGFCGDDADGIAVEKCLRNMGVEAVLTHVSTHPTTTKLRIAGGRQQMLRLDTEVTDDYPPDAYEALIESVERAFVTANVLVLSDYAKGVLSERTCQHLIAAARSRGIPVLVDPKQRDFSRYRGATTICPNLSELSVASGAPPKDLEAILAAGQRLVSTLDLDFIVATMSEKGIAILREESRWIAPAVARQVFDVSGAGDAVIGTLSVAIANGVQLETAVQIANVAAGVVVSKVGTVAITRNELLMSLMPEIELQAKEKVLSIDQLLLRSSAWRSAGQSIVFTNGCFDLLHFGHIALMEDARREGDRLVVAINSDASVSALKGPFRPIVGEQERARILAALSAVDAVIIFHEPTPIRLIEALRPDVIVKGGDYREDAVVGAKEVSSWDGRVKIVPMVQGFSTTKLIAKATTLILQ
jgi:D-beta-D-heptose 7-phosphate kinase/D-beta-D-heptose 1-phosphate adenosyltransferase